MTALFAEFEVAGVLFHQRLCDEPWGARTFIVSDPDGNLILFAGEVEQVEPPPQPSPTSRERECYLAICTSPCCSRTAWKVSFG